MHDPTGIKAKVILQPVYYASHFIFVLIVRDPTGVRRDDDAARTVVRGIYIFDSLRKYKHASKDVMLQVIRERYFVAAERDAVQFFDIDDCAQQADGSDDCSIFVAHNLLQAVHRLLPVPAGRRVPEFAEYRTLADAARGETVRLDLMRRMQHYCGLFKNGWSLPAAPDASPLEKRFRALYEYHTGPIGQDARDRFFKIVTSVTNLPTSAGGALVKIHTNIRNQDASGCVTFVVDGAFDEVDVSTRNRGVPVSDRDKLQGLPPSIRESVRRLGRTAYLSDVLQLLSDAA